VCPWLLLSAMQRRAYIELIKSSSEAMHSDHVNMPADPKTEKPSVVINRVQTHQAASELMEAITRTNDPPFLFRRCRDILHIHPDGVTRTLDAEALKDLMDRSARVIKVAKNGEATLAPLPLAPAKSVLAGDLTRFGLPVLKEVLHTPTLLKNGRVLDRPGYDPASQLYLALPSGFKILRRPPPSKAAAIEAYAWIANIMGDFAWDDSASLANAMAFILGVAARNVIDSIMPLALVGKKFGAGKTLLCNVLAILATGTRPTLVQFPESNDQLRKLLLSHFRESPAATVFDNVANGRTLNPAALNSALTAGIFKDRILQSSKNSSFDLRGHPMLLNGNTLKLKYEFARRCLPITLLSSASNPTLRQPKGGFKYPGEALLEFCLENRSVVNSKSLTILESWCLERDRNGIPGQGQTPQIPSFEKWSEIVGSIMFFCGQGHLFLAGRQETLLEKAEDPQEEFAFVGAIVDTFGSDCFKASELWARIEEGGTIGELVPKSLRDALKGGDRKSAAVGVWLRDRRDTYFGPDDNILLRREKDLDRAGAAIWQLVTAASDDASE